MIVNKDHPVAKLIKQHYHEENLHVGREKTLSSRKSKYWIPACRGIIGSLIIYCLYCKRKIITPVHYFTCNVSTNFELTKNPSPILVLIA